ncbi:lysozyme, partial [Pseudomonas sp. SDT291_1_S447]
MSLRGRIQAGVIALASAPLVIFLGTWEGRGQNTVYADKLASGLPTVCKGITR